MAVNTQPLFVMTPRNSFTGSVTAANTTRNGTGTVNLLFTAGVDGSILNNVLMQALGTNAATMARFFLNNGSDPTVAANNTLIAERQLTATTASETVPTPPFEWVPGLKLKGGVTPERVYVVLATAVAAGYQFTAFGGDF